jgi:hypothetical protein
LVTAQINAANEFLTEFQKYAPAVVAFWARNSDDGEWGLYVALEALDEDKLRVAYGEVLRISSETNDPNFDPFHVKLVGLQHPLARYALEAYLSCPTRLPIFMQATELQDLGADELYVVKGPTGEYSMPTGRETLHQIIDKEAEYFQTHGASPRKMKLPVLMAYDLAKCGREDLGELSGRIFKDGIAVLEKEGFHGMQVEIVRDRNATLQFE